MGYQKAVYDQALAQLSQNRQKMLEQTSFRRDQLYEKYPRLREIEAELAQNATGITKAVLSGENIHEALERLKSASLTLQEERKSILRFAGLKENYLEPCYSCPDCKDTGYRDGRLCGCVRKLARSIAFTKLSEASPLALSDFESFDCGYYSDGKDTSGVSPRARMKNNLNICREYAATFTLASPSLIFKGNTGLGKTHLSLAIAGRVIEKGYGVIYGSAQNLLHKIELEHFGRGEGGEDTLQALIDCDLLVLDDLGAEFSSAFSAAAVYNILNSRINLQRPTIISTNLNLDEIEKRYSDRVGSRILGNYRALLFVGRDVRQERLKRK